MPEADVELTTEAAAREDAPRSLHLRCSRANYKLLGLAPDEFPMLPQVSQDTRFNVPRGVLREAIKQVLFAVSSDEARPVLTGVLAVYKEGKLRLVATDTHRLAVRDLQVTDGSGIDAQAIIPARAMSEVQRILSGDDEGAATVTLSANQVKFELADTKHGSATTLISRLIEGVFPSYERVIPQNYERRLGIERDPLLAALRRASIIARETSNRVVLKAQDAGSGEGGNMSITAISGSLGNAFEELEITRDGETTPFEIAFNVKYLMDVLSVLDGQGLHLELTEPLRPGVVRPTDDAEYFCVLMPMQVV
jgi:DNA polymerase-3 subunit beta